MRMRRAIGGWMNDQIMDKGLYIAVFYLGKTQHICIGKLGEVRFRQGMYFYVGSAQRNLSARINRHSRKKKPLRWHIDYLSVKTIMLGAIVVPGPRERECELVKEISGMYQLAIPGFGSSDCRCRGHLFYVSDKDW